MNTTSIICVGVLASFTVASEKKGENEMWICTVEQWGGRETKTLTPRRVKEMFEELEKREERAKRNPPTNSEKERFAKAVFRFTKTSSETIRYLTFYDEEPFGIEVAIGENKTRRIYYGDEALRKKITEIVDKALPKPKN